MILVTKTLSCDIVIDLPLMEKISSDKIFLLILNKHVFFTKVSKIVIVQLSCFLFIGCKLFKNQ